MIKSRAEDRPRTIGRGLSGRCAAQIVHASISAMSRLAGSAICRLGSHKRRGSPREQGDTEERIACEGWCTIGAPPSKPHDTLRFCPKGGGPQSPEGRPDHANMVRSGVKPFGSRTLFPQKSGGLSLHRAYARCGARKSTDRRAVTAGIVYEHRGVGAPQPRRAGDQKANQVRCIRETAIEAEAEIAKSVWRCQGVNAAVAFPGGLFVDLADGDRGI